MVSFELLTAGSCTHRERAIIRDGRSDAVSIPALVGLIEHPREGLILFDTGYSQHFHAQTARFPGTLYAKVTPVALHPEETVKSQLAARGVDAREVRTIILSHFHADHVGAVRDFPAARFVCARSAYGALRDRRGLNALRAGFLPGLLPDDFADRATYVEDLPEVDLPERLQPFRRGRDLLGDGSVVLVELPGHALGHYGAWVDSSPEVFLVGDACWVSRSFRDRVPPSALAHVIFSDARLFRETLSKLHTLHRTHPDLLIVPSHCSEARDRVRQRQAALL